MATIDEHCMKLRDILGELNNEIAVIEKGHEANQPQVFVAISALRKSISLVELDVHTLEAGMSYGG